MSEEQLYQRYLPGYSDAKTDDERQRLWQLASPKTRYLIDCERQQMYGEGSDLISFHDTQRSQLVPTSWPNLLSLDIAHWQHKHWSPQYQVIQNSHSVLSKTSPPNYINQFGGEQIRLFYRSRFVYARLYSALHYILIHAKLMSDQWSQERHPYHLPLELYQPPESIQSSPSMVTENGYQSLRNHFLQSYSDWADDQYFNWLRSFNDELNHQTPAAYIIEYQDKDGMPWIDFICKNENALAIVRPEHFVEDIEQIATSNQFLEHQVQKLAAQIEKSCREQGW